MYMVCVFTLSPTAIYMYSTIILLSSFTPDPFHHIANCTNKSKIVNEIIGNENCHYTEKQVKGVLSHLYCLGFVLLSIISLHKPRITCTKLYSCYATKI